MKATARPIFKTTHRLVVLTIVAIFTGLSAIAEAPAKGTATMHAELETGGSGVFWYNDELNPGEHKVRLVSYHHAAHNTGNLACLISTTADNGKPVELKRIFFEVNITWQAHKKVTPSVAIEYVDQSGATQIRKLEQKDFAVTAGQKGRQLWTYDFPAPLKVTNIAIGGKELPHRIGSWDTTASLDCTVSHFKAIDSGQNELDSAYDLTKQVVKPGADPLLKDLTGTVE